MAVPIALLVVPGGGAEVQVTSEVGSVTGGTETMLAGTAPTMMQIGDRWVKGRVAEEGVAVTGPGSTARATSSSTAW